MALKDKMENKFEVTVNKTRNDIFKALELRKDNFEWTNALLPDTIYYREIKVKDGKLKIIRYPTPISPFRPFGKITIDIKVLQDGQTHLLCNILPFAGHLTTILIIYSVGISLWTLAMLSVMIIIDEVSIPILVFPCLGFALIFLLYYKYCRRSLIDYSKRLIEELAEMNASR